MLALTPRVTVAIEALFDESDASPAKDLLMRECGDNLPFHADSAPAGLDRVRLAALKCSGGDLARLKMAVELAKTDWRDLLLEAGFGEDIEAHEKWAP